MDEIQRLLISYKEKLELRDRLGREYIILINNKIENDRKQQLENKFNLLSKDMNFISNKFIEMFLI